MAKVNLVFLDIEDLSGIEKTIADIMYNFCQRDSKLGPCFLDSTVALAGKPIILRFSKKDDGTRCFQIQIADTREIEDKRESLTCFDNNMTLYPDYIYGRLFEDKRKAEWWQKVPERMDIVAYFFIIFDRLKSTLLATGRLGSLSVNSDRDGDKVHWDVTIVPI